MENIEFRGSLGTYKLLETGDGSQSLYSFAFEESCHSQSGAENETKHVYFCGSQVLKHFQNKAALTVFEVGFATGLGFKITLQCLLKEMNTKAFELNFISSEIDELLAKHSLSQLVSNQVIQEFKLIEEEKFSYFKARTKNNHRLIVLLGDIREVIGHWQDHAEFKAFDRIYHDPFSPKKNPTLWTQEWFEQLHKLSTNSAVLSTYSSTRAAWKALLSTGWQVETFTGVGKKRLSTRAKKEGKTKAYIFELCKNSPKEAFRDCDYLKA